MISLCLILEIYKDVFSKNLHAATKHGPKIKPSAKPKRVTKGTTRVHSALLAVAPSCRVPVSRRGPPRPVPSSARAGAAPLPARPPAPRGQKRRNWLAVAGKNRKRVNDRSEQGREGTRPSAADAGRPGRAVPARVRCLEPSFHGSTVARHRSD